MALRPTMLSFQDQLKLRGLSEEDRKEVLSQPDKLSAISLLAKKETIKKLPEGIYEPTLQISGSSVKYKTKNLFTENFDEKDVIDFSEIFELINSNSEVNYEVIIGEIKRKCNKMIKEKKQPIQCLVYSTKCKEKVFFNNEKKVIELAKHIAVLVNENSSYLSSITHMLVNWDMWKNQIQLLIMSCTYIKESEKLDEIIRELYTQHESDKIRYAVYNRLFNSNDEKNYKAAFNMLKNCDFITSIQDKKYFNVLREVSKGVNAEAIHNVYRQMTGFDSKAKQKIDNLFITEYKAEDDTIFLINSDDSKKEKVLNEVKTLLFSGYKNYKDFIFNINKIKNFKTEILEVMMEHLSQNKVTYNDIKHIGIAIGNLGGEKGISFLKNQRSLTNDDNIRLVYSYVLAYLSDSFINEYTKSMLCYDTSNSPGLLETVRQITHNGKITIIRKCLFENFSEIVANTPETSMKTERAYKNMSIIIHSTSAASSYYDLRYDNVFFEFLGYDKTSQSLQDGKCTYRKTTMVLNILENVMDKNNYNGRYMLFMGVLYSFFKNTKIDLSNRIDNIAKLLTGQGIPAINEENIHGL